MCYICYPTYEAPSNVRKYISILFQTFLPMTDVSMQKRNNSLWLHVTSGLGIHSFERVVGFLTQNYNQDF